MNLAINIREDGTIQAGIGPERFSALDWAAKHNEELRALRPNSGLALGGLPQRIRARVRPGKPEHEMPPPSVVRWSHLPGTGRERKVWQLPQSDQAT